MGLIELERGIRETKASKQVTDDEKQAALTAAYLSSVDFLCSLEKIQDPAITNVMREAQSRIDAGLVGFDIYDALTPETASLVKSDPNVNRIVFNGLQDDAGKRSAIVYLPSNYLEAVSKDPLIYLDDVVYAGSCIRDFFSGKADKQIKWGLMHRRAAAFRAEAIKKLSLIGPEQRFPIKLANKQFDRMLLNPYGLMSPIYPKVKLKNIPRH